MPFSAGNFLTAALYLGVIGGIAFIVQLFFHWRLVTGEYSRKLIHIFTALWIATWRLNLSQLEVTYLCLFLLFGIFLAKQFQMFHSVFGVERTTYGEFMFVIGVMITALAFTSPMVFALAVINLGVADGLAAVIGIKYGRKKYDVFGSTKSIAGLLTSFTVVLITGTCFWVFFVEHQLNLPFTVVYLVSTAAVISGLEFVSCKGLDNLTIPLATGLLYANLIV